MIEDIRKTALAHAMELSRGRVSSEASDIVKDASVFEAYLTGQITSRAPVHNAASGVEPSLDLSACDCRIFDRDSGQFLPVRQCKLAGNDKDLLEQFSTLLNGRVRMHPAPDLRCPDQGLPRYGVSVCKWSGAVSAVSSGENALVTYSPPYSTVPNSVSFFMVSPVRDLNNHETGRGKFRGERIRIRESRKGSEDDA